MYNKNKTTVHIKRAFKAKIITAINLQGRHKNTLNFKLTENSQINNWKSITVE